MKRSILPPVYVAAVTCLYLGSKATAENRTWSDLTGNYEVEAEFNGLEDGKVTFKKADVSCSNHSFWCVWTKLVKC